MLLVLDDILDAAARARIVARLRTASWRDGRMTAGHQSARHDTFEHGLVDAVFGGVAMSHLGQRATGTLRVFGRRGWRRAGKGSYKLYRLGKSMKKFEGRASRGSDHFLIR